MLKNALSYLKKGKSIIPIGKDKKPLIPWKEYQTRLATEEEVTKWFTTWKDANLGIVTGKISNLTVVDVEKGGSVSDLPMTLVARTGGGGWHYYYKFHDTPNMARFRELTDIRSEGGYVVAPPSIHSSGQRYEWAIQEEIADFPVWLLPNKNNWNDIAVGTEAGNRNQTAAKMAGKLLGAFKQNEWEEIVWTLLQAWNDKNNPPLGVKELRSVFNSIASRQLKEEQVVKEEDIDIVHIFDCASDEEDTDKYKTKFFVDDAIGGGVESGDLVIISAPTGQGKTTLMQTLTKNFSEQSLPSLWFSYEVLLRHLKKNFEEMGMSKEDVIFAPLKISSGSVGFIHQAVKKAKKEQYVKMVFIDHLGFLVPKLSKNDISRNFSAYLGQICRELKLMAVEEEIIIVLAAHMRKTDNPSIEDIRDSSGIAQEADLVLTLQRTILNNDEQYYGDQTTLTIVKNRKTGATKKGKIILRNRCFEEDRVYVPKPVKDNKLFN